MKALVVGGNGFIGSHLVDRLAACGWDVSVLDLWERRYDPLPETVRYIQGDLSQMYLVREALDGVDVVFHLAWSTIHEVSNRDPEADILANLVPSVQLMDACRQMGVGRFVFLSSGGTVYGPVERVPIRESFPQNPISAYGITKLAVEKYLQLYHRLYNLDYVILRPSVPYGPRQNPLGKQGVIPVFLYHIGNNLPVTIWGDGSVTRDFFFISDLVDAIVAAATKSLGRERIFNLGGGMETSLLELVEMVELTVGRKAVIDFQPPRNFDAPRIRLDIELAKKTLGWTPGVPLQDGLAYTWSWIASRLFERNVFALGKNGKIGANISKL